MKWCVWLLVALVGVVGGRLASQPRETTRQVAKTQRRLKARENATENYYKSLELARPKPKLGETCLSEDGSKKMKSAISLRMRGIAQRVFVDDWSATMPWEPKEYNPSDAASEKALSRGAYGRDQVLSRGANGKDQKPSENPDKEKKKKKKKNKGKDKKEGILEGAADAGETSFSEV
eukprot:Platyproteum_vivax@DN6824_c2_g1_i3.p1